MKVDFYVIDSNSKMQALNRLCYTLEKPYADKQTVFINTTSKEEAELIDKLLWTYRDDSFLAHELLDNADDNTTIVIGANQQPNSATDILVNLQTEVPANLAQFRQVIEFVFKDSVVEQLGRDRYRQYRDQGHEINTHKLKATQ